MAAGLYCAGGGDRPRLNVLLITLDTTRADRMGFAGYGRPTTPHLDALAAESVVFDHAIAQAAVTPVSHASILTGLEPYHHGLRVLHGLAANRLPEEATTLAEIWRGLGGRTAAFVSAYPVTESFGLRQGFGLFDADFRQSDGTGLVTGGGTVNTGLSQRGADQTTHEALAWLRDRRDEDPFLLWVHYFDPHDAYLMPDRAWVERTMRSGFAPASQEKADQLRTIYDCEIRFMDEQIGRLLAAFETAGLWEETVIVVVGDHGEGLGDHNWWSHGILYQEQIRVPLLIRVPSWECAGRVSDLVRTIDLAPTVLEAAGIREAAHPPFDGRSLGEAMRSGRCESPRTAYSESVNILTYGRPDSRALRDQKDDKLYCLMTARHKLIYHQLEPEETEFYDLVSDPAEQRNLASSRPAAMEELLEQLHALDAFSPIMPGMTPTDLERVRNLRSLGYIE